MSSSRQYVIQVTPDADMEIVGVCQDTIELGIESMVGGLPQEEKESYLNNLLYEKHSSGQAIRIVHDQEPFSGTMNPVASQLLGLKGFAEPIYGNAVICKAELIDGKEILSGLTKEELDTITNHIAHDCATWTMDYKGKVELGTYPIDGMPPENWPENNTYQYHTEDCIEIF